MTSAQLTRHPAEPRLVDEPSVRLGLGGFALFAAAGLVASTAPPAVPATVALVALAAAWSLTLPRAEACLLGLTGWAFAEGFALHQYGELHLAPGDLALLGAAVLACLAASVVGER